MSGAAAARPAPRPAPPARQSGSRRPEAGRGGAGPGRGFPQTSARLPAPPRRRPSGNQPSPGGAGKGGGQGTTYRPSRFYLPGSTHLPNIRRVYPPRSATQTRQPPPLRTTRPAPSRNSSRACTSPLPTSSPCTRPPPVPDPRLTPLRPAREPLCGGQMAAPWILGQPGFPPRWRPSGLGRVVLLINPLWSDVGLLQGWLLSWAQPSGPGTAAESGAVGVLCP